MQGYYGWMCLALLGVPICANAQWVNHRDSVLPRTRDGKVNLSAPAPRTSGKPDLSGIWEVESSP